MLFSDHLFQQMPIVGILRGYSKSDTLQIVDAYYQAGFTTIELTMNTPNVVDILTIITTKYRGKLNIGAGTVCNTKELKLALNAGAQFIVSPILSLDLMEQCKKENIPIFPGAYTPTEIYSAWQAGAKMVKVFPATMLGPKYIKEVLAPLNDIALMPTGGVQLENMAAYHKAGAKAFGVGSLLFNKEMIQAKTWKMLTEHLAYIRQQIMEIL